MPGCSVGVNAQLIDWAGRPGSSPGLCKRILELLQVGCQCLLLIMWLKLQQACHGRDRQACETRGQCLAMQLEGCHWCTSRVHQLQCSLWCRSQGRTASQGGTCAHCSCCCGRTPAAMCHPCPGERVCALHAVAARGIVCVQRNLPCAVLADAPMSSTACCGDAA